MSELKACPFCGVGGGMNEAHKPDCYLTIQVNKLKNRKQLESFWNTRPLEDAIRSRVEELERDADITKVILDSKQASINELTAENARLREQVRWRSPDNGELPKIGDEILVQFIENLEVERWVIDKVELDRLLAYKARWLPIPPEVNNE